MRLRQVAIINGLLIFNSHIAFFIDLTYSTTSYSEKLPRKQFHSRGNKSRSVNQECLFQVRIHKLNYPQLSSQTESSPCCHINHSAMLQALSLVLCYRPSFPCMPSHSYILNVHSLREPAVQVCESH